MTVDTKQSLFLSYCPTVSNFSWLIDNHFHCHEEVSMQQGFKSGFVIIVGRPNVGKSTLLNRLVGSNVAIMSDKPQTTRNKITWILTTEKAQIIFIDTPGIHKPKHKLGEYMVSTALRSMEEADCILYLIDASVEIGAGEEYIQTLLDQLTTPVFLV